MSENLLVPGNTTPELAITPTNSTWSIYQADSSDDVNNNSSSNGNSTTFTDSYPQVRRRNSFTEMPGLSLSCDDFVNLQDESFITQSNSLVRNNQHHDDDNDTAFIDRYSQRERRDSSRQLSALGVSRDEFSDLQDNSYITKNDNFVTNSDHDHDVTLLPVDRSDVDNDVMSSRFLDRSDVDDDVMSSRFLDSLDSCEEYSGMREDRRYSIVGDPTQARPVRKRCNSYMEYSDYEESNALSGVADSVASTSFDVSESETESHNDHVDDSDILTSILALRRLSKDEIVRDSTAILLQLYEENQSLRDQCASHEKLYLENTETIKQLQYDLTRKGRLLKDLCVELDEKNFHLNPDTNTENLSRCELRERILQLEDENEAYKAANDMLQAEKEDMTKQEDNYEQQIQQLQDEFALSKDDLRKLSEEHNKCENNTKELVDSVKDLKIIIRHLTYENLELTETIQGLRNSTDKKMDEELRNVRDRCDELQEQLTKAHEDQRRASCSAPNKLDNSLGDSDDSIFSEITRTVPKHADLPPNLAPVRNRTKSCSRPPRQRRPEALRRRAASVTQSLAATSSQTAQQADLENLPKLTSLFSGTSILNRVGLLVAGLAAVGAVSLVEPTGLVAESGLDMGKPGTPGSGDLEAALARLSTLHTTVANDGPLTIINFAEENAIKTASPVESSTNVASGRENTAFSTTPLTVSIFRFLSSLTKPTCSPTFLTNPAYSVTSCSGMNAVLCLDSHGAKKKASIVQRSSSSFTTFPSVRRRTSLPNELVASPLPSSNSQRVTMTSAQYVTSCLPTSATVCSRNEDNGESTHTTTSRKTSRAVRFSDWSLNNDVMPVKTLQTSQSVPSMRMTSCTSVLGALTSFRQTGTFSAQQTTYDKNIGIASVLSPALERLVNSFQFQFNLSPNTKQFGVSKHNRDNNK
ncbi:uncharacterized protein LOC121387467 [Gigantopelta aegis]|uniref:uncharacterized protein LOC121387467 n=1 Tax=Gigantopelta aegis TaxID=1735272 RepID=UPI001B889173|nr:uncharacterized protein LOC121387467 [Gigantopelta aegis]